MGELAQAVLSQMLWQSPLLLAYVAGVISAVMSWRRWRRQSVLTLIGTGGLLLINIIRTVSLQYFVAFGREWGWETQQLGSTVISVQGFIAAILQGSCVCLLVWAVFSDRDGSTAYDV